MTAAPTSARAVATKTAVDQIFLAPIFTSVFFGAMKAMDGKADEVASEVKEKLWPTMKVNWTVYVVSFPEAIFPIKRETTESTNEFTCAHFTLH